MYTLYWDTVSYYNTQRNEELGSVEKSQDQRMARKMD